MWKSRFPAPFTMQNKMFPACVSRVQKMNETNSFRAFPVCAIRAYLLQPFPIKMSQSEMSFHNRKDLLIQSRVPSDPIFIHILSIKRMPRFQKDLFNQRDLIQSSVSIRIRSIGNDFARVRRSSAFLNVTIPEKEIENPISIAFSASSRPDVKQCIRPG